MRKPPAGAVCSMRAAMLTAMPRMRAFGIDAAAEQHAAGVDADAHVEAGVAVRGLHFARRAPCRVRAGPGRSARRVRRRPRAASSAPKAASRLSPAYCSTLPPCAATTAVPRASAPSITSLMASGSRCWLSAVEPTTSRNRMVTCLRAWAGSSGGIADRAASLALSGATAVSTTASLSSARCASRAAIAASSCLLLWRHRCAG